MIEVLATTHFAWFQELVKRRYGLQAEEYAGAAFMRVAEEYDASKGEFRAYASKAVKFVMLNLYSGEHGRSGSKRREMELASSRSEAMTNVGDATSQCDLLDVLRAIDDGYGASIDSPRLPRVVAICRTLGLFDDGDIAFMLRRRSLRGVVPVSIAS